jgi:hypothetical protein
LQTVPVVCSEKSPSGYLGVKDKHDNILFLILKFIAQISGSEIKIYPGLNSIAKLRITGSTAEFTNCIKTFDIL